MFGKYAAAAMLLTTGCATTFVREDIPKGRQWTIGREVGMAPSLYQAAYEREADRRCPQGYIVLEKNREPSTLRALGVKQSDSLFYWVIRCN